MASTPLDIATHEVRLVPRNLHWEVVVDGVCRRMIDWLCTKERALEHAMERLEEIFVLDTKRRAVVVVERPDHSIERRIVVTAEQLSAGEPTRNAV